ncbi:MAG TPA: hypothetical protein DCE55_02665 [Planctomycetaceae bacterium]|nr:hypothetical protein [Planctomycetaceae bacterium]
MVQRLSSKPRPAIGHPADEMIGCHCCQIRVVAPLPATLGDRTMRKLMLTCVLGLILSAGGYDANAADLKVGDPAPEFTLKGSDGKTYKLSSFKGKQAVVLAWFPKAFTGG